MKNHLLQLKKILAIVLLSFLGINYVQAQSFVFHAEFVDTWSGPGYNFTEDINGYPSVTVQATSADDEFIIETDSYYNKWDNYGTLNINTSTPFVFYGNTPSFDPGNSFLSMSADSGKFYTTRIQNVGYSSTNVIMMVTDNLPVGFDSVNAVTQNPVGAVIPVNTAVEITVKLSQARSIQERVYVRFTNDNWITSSVSEVSFNTLADTIGTAVISAQAPGSSVNYYVLTTTLDLNLAGANYDLVTLKQENNTGANYQYTVNSLPIGTAAITFRVNMSLQTVDASGLFLAGTFNGFSTTATPMQLISNNVYQAIVIMDTNITAQYKFVNGTTFETGNALCGVSDGLGGYNRNLVMPEMDSVLSVVCFNECIDCAMPVFTPVTFNVNMSNETAPFQHVYLTGDFNNFALSDTMTAQGNGIYSLTLDLDTSMVFQYKFANDGGTFPTYELIPILCGVDDGTGILNREVSVTANAMNLPLVCFNECDNCLPVSIATIKNNEIKLYPVPASNQLTIQVSNLNPNTTLELFQSDGRKVKEQKVVSQITTIDLSSFDAGVYFVKLSNNSEIITQRFVKK